MKFYSLVLSFTVWSITLNSYTLWLFFNVAFKRHYLFVCCPHTYGIAAVQNIILFLKKHINKFLMTFRSCLLYPRSPNGEGDILFYLCPSVLPSVQDIFRRIFLSNCWWQKSDIWSQASYRYTILWVAFLDPSDSYFLFADLVGFYTHWIRVITILQRESQNS
jgi:hypothetical protein